MIVFFIFLAFVVFAIMIRLLAGGVDHDRVRQYIEECGGKVLNLNWEPFGPGWFGEKSDRIYCVNYIDKDGNEHETHCKTSMWTGVYFTKDQIVKHAEKSASDSTSKQSLLEAENQQLKEELERFKRQQSQG